MIYQDFAHPNFKLGFTGATGTGKTTLALRLIREWITSGKYDYIFVFDFERQWAKRLGVEATDRIDYAVASIGQSGGVCFDPTRIWNGNIHKAFAWFCEWYWNFCGAFPGDKLLIADDISDYLPKDDYLNHPMSKLMGAVRRRGGDIMALWRMSTEVSATFRGNFSEYYAFQQPDADCAKNISRLGIPLHGLQQLLPGEYFHLEKATGKLTQAKINLPKKQ